MQASMQQHPYPHSIYRCNSRIIHHIQFKNIVYWGGNFNRFHCFFQGQNAVASEVHLSTYIECTQVMFTCAVIVGGLSIKTTMYPKIIFQILASTLKHFQCCDEKKERKKRNLKMNTCIN